MENKTHGDVCSVCRNQLKKKKKGCKHFSYFNFSNTKQSIALAQALSSFFIEAFSTVIVH